MSREDDTIDLMDGARSVRRGWREVAVFTLLGVLAAAAVLLYAPKRYSGSASVILRAADDRGSLLSRIGVDGDIGGLLGSGGKSPMETELEVLESRALLGAVVDSLLLQVVVAEPGEANAADVVRSVTAPGTFAPMRIALERNAGGGYTLAEGADHGVRLSGDSLILSGGRIVLAPGLTARRMELTVRDREDAIDAVAKKLHVEKTGGEVARLEFVAPDPGSAAAVPNVLLATYLERRRTTDRGVNQHRAEFLQAQIDSVSGQLVAAERAMRAQQEASGILEPTTAGRLALERAGELRSQLTTVEVERGAIDQLMAAQASGTMTSRQLAALPAFIRSGAITELLGQITRLETQRQLLLEKRLETDPEVEAISASIRSAENQIVPLATAYAASLREQRATITSELAMAQSALTRFPGAAEASNRLQRDVLRLGQIYAALQAQLVEARLAAIGEGGDVKVLDTAVLPKQPSFPKPVQTMALGAFGGMFAGVLAALFMGATGRWMRDPLQIERATGLPTMRFDRRTPLLLGGGLKARTILVLPTEKSVNVTPVARRLAETAVARSASATVLDLSGADVAALPAGSTASAMNVNATIERLEQSHDVVIVQLPHLSHEHTVAALQESRPVLLVTPPQRIDRGELMAAVRTLDRLGVPCAGVVVGSSGHDALPA